jgi:MFS family permease
LNRELTRLLAGYFCLHAAFAGVRMAVPLLALDRGSEKAAVGLLIALFAIPPALFSIPLGRWIDRRGIKLPLRSSVVLATFGALVAAASTSLPGLCIAAACAGASMGAATIAIQRHVGRTEHTPAGLRRAFSWLSFAPALANTAGALIAGLVIDSAGYRAAFLILALVPLLGYVCIGLQQDFADAGTDEPASGTVWDLWMAPGFRRLLLMNWFAAASFDAHNFIIPVLGHERGLSASAIGSILGAFALATAAIRLALPAIVARLSEWRFIAIAMGSAALFFCLYPLADTPVAMAVCSAFLGASVGGVHPMVMSLLHQITPHNRHGEAVAMRFWMVNVSNVGMPMVFGLAGTLSGAAGLLWLMGGAMALGCRMSFRLRGLIASGPDPGAGDPPKTGG